MQEIFTRRSVRSFTAQEVTENQIMQLIRAAMQAPSSHNQQPWEFVVLRETASKLAILDFHPYATPVKTASHVIAVCGNLDRRKNENDCWLLDCAAATQNLLLEAVTLGLGAVWLGIYPYENRIAALSKQLNLPQRVIPFCLVAVGYPAEKSQAVERFDSARIRYETW